MIFNWQTKKNRHERYKIVLILTHYINFVLKGLTVNHMQYVEETFCLFGAISQ